MDEIVLHFCKLSTQKYAVKAPEVLLYRVAHEILLTRRSFRNSFHVRNLRKLCFGGPSIFILGPPGSGKQTLSEMLANKLNYVVLDAPAVYALCPQGQETPPKELALALKKRLKESDCESRGYMIVGFPVTESQAKALRWEGIFPDYTVFLEASVEALIERQSGNRIDPETGESYHLLMKPPPNLQVENRLIPHPDFSPNEIREKIEAYERENFILQQIYDTSARMFNADQPLTDVYASVLAYVTQPPRSLALRTPRILLLGFVGSGRKTQAKLLAGKYGLVPVDCSALINQEIASVSLLGKAMKSYVARNMAVPDAIVVETVKARLTQPDCTTRGWILHGYPRSKQQAELLDAEGLTPNRVFALDISHICAAERLTGRRIDPVTGQRFHLSNKPFDDDISVQMLQNPQDRECVIGSKLAKFAAHKEQLYEYYASNVIHIHADVDVHTVFEEIEAGLVNPLPQDKSTKM
ncbi:hypothetical protein CRM22_006827 [Opisthorchis felineus]|uniref:Adenylate kinase active site lid domain-containing protein n=1 Tax=Opisthorchis felineus TaxID=147828 RepID=A0A4S2LJ53_OPIFE|nr:hypothetical protein CRM22_006827 [Opisthorchis felineus]